MDHSDQKTTVTGEVIYQKEIVSELENKNQVLDETMQVIGKAVDLDDRLNFGFRLCMDEALVNAIMHGNKEDTSKTVTVAVYLEESVLKISVQDQGEGFVPEAVPDQKEEESLFLEHGRGVAFMENYFDGVAYYDHGRHLVLKKEFV